MKTSVYIPPRNLFSRALRYFLMSAVLLFPIVARATNATVDCSGATPGAFTSIASALATLDNIGPHTVILVSSCTENVQIIQRDRLTIQAPIASTATISAANPGLATINIDGSRNIILQRLVISGGSIGVSASRASSVQITGTVIDSSGSNGLQLAGNSVGIIGGNATTQFITISNHPGAGINVNGSFLQINGGATIENNLGFGITVNGGRLILNGNVQDNIVRNNGSGINVSGAPATFNGQNLIQNNGDTGVQIANGSSGAFNAIEISPGTFRVNIIEGHTTIGLHIAAAGSGNLAGPNIIRNNGSTGFGLQDVHGGVNIGTVSRIQFSGGNQITGNIGPGVTSRFNGAVALGDSIVTDNTEQGFLLLRQSVGVFDMVANVSNNGISNVACDTTSLVAGNLTGITNISCSQIERTQGPPRPGANVTLPNPHPLVP